MISAPKLIYPTLEAYYAADERRRNSEETDYGVHWRLDSWEYRWGVSYVRNNGEIYAVHQGATIGPVFILGHVPPDPVGGRGRCSLFYRTLDDIPIGWPGHCSRQDGLVWLRERLASAGARFPSELTGTCSVWHRSCKVKCWCRPASVRYKQTNAAEVFLHRSYFSVSGPRKTKFSFIQNMSRPVASLWAHALPFSCRCRGMGW